MFPPEQVVRHAVHTTRMMYTKSSTVKKAHDEESIKLSAMAREHIQNHEGQVNRKNLNPLETLRRAKLEQKMNSNVQAASKAYGQHRGKQPEKDMG